MRWLRRAVDPYTGNHIDEPGALDIDHLVPLRNAHWSGAWQWTNEKRRRYYNNLDEHAHLIAVKAGVNRSKASRGPEAWRPPNRAAWCQYATGWIAVKQAWGLSATPKEAEALTEMLGTCLRWGRLPSGIG